MSSCRLRLFALVALAALVAACGPEGAAGPDVAATVNGEEIAIAEVRDRYDAVSENPQFAEQLAGDDSGAFEQQVQAEILTGLIRSRLLHQGAADLGVELTDEDVEAKREGIIEEVGGEDAFAEIIETNNLTEETVDSQLRDLAMQDLVAEALTADVDVDDEQVAEEYERSYGTASARHILVETEEQAQQVLARLEAGEDFGALAQELSTDPSAAQNAGDLGQFGRGDMVPEFADAVFSAEEGQIVGPVQTQFGFHVIEVTEIDPGPPLEDVEEEIVAQLLEGERGQLLQEWLDERSAQAEVTVNPRFGEWDAEAGRVVPADALGEEEGEEAEDGGSPTSPRSPPEPDAAES
ncbi:MAG TPA: peptidylprolyl isomerase [Egibacteraceae bacterium]|nr:peptidylprolyl isomerase [Egibacteraceae bacterium]